MKKATSILMGTLLVIAVAVLPFIKLENFVTAEQKNYKAILTIWQIDTFEGGVGSRTSFLKKVANKFTKSHSGILFLVTSHTVESARLSIKNNEYPDVISFGGCGLELADNLYALSSKTDYTVGQVNGKQYITPWCKGGYFLIKKGSKTASKIIVGEGEYNLSQVALCLEDINAKTIVVKSPKEAYSLFLDSKDCYFLGTQRDIVRLENRNEEFVATALNNFNDLYQHIAVTSNDEQKRQYAKTFIEYLLSKEVQKTLTDIKMLSVIDCNLYGDSQNYGSLEKSKITHTTSPFLTEEEFLTIKRTAQAVLNGKIDRSELLKFIKQL